MGMDQAPESRFGLRFSACGVLDLCHVRNVKKLDQVNCAKLTYIQSSCVDRWKKYSMYTLGLGLHKIGSLSLSLSS